MAPQVTIKKRQHPADHTVGEASLCTASIGAVAARLPGRLLDRTGTSYDRGITGRRMRNKRLRGGGSSARVVGCRPARVSVEDAAYVRDQPCPALTCPVRRLRTAEPLARVI
ncbi:hypothetical protein Mth01_10460 [Sphaerimonospora thailandensis]|uniref:Uncharacterized protein n=1 Tax=Sphaerimonospora thailandensis TaxID=795644 RepID=A0A8J3VYA4_9ACTN|nr:hypothetical protein Mth01_10460 [Sphaerimonospora thailandensis]